MLSDTEIRSELGKDIIIIPFDEKQVKPNSYDVRLGEWFYIEDFNSYERQCNVYDRASFWGTWLPHQAEVERDKKSKLYGRQVLWLRPGQRVLGHTKEFIGGRGRITTTIKCRSSIGRSGLSICLCAGSGDVGYVNRWTLEITNHLRYHSLPLVVSEPVAQILFHRTGECASPYTGKYQSSASLEELILGWKPEMMLPRLYEDAEKWQSVESSKAAAVSFAANTIKVTAMAIERIVATTAVAAAREAAAGCQAARSKTVGASRVDELMSRSAANDTAATELVAPSTSSREDNVASSTTDTAESLSASVDAARVEPNKPPEGAAALSDKPPGSTIVLCRRGQDRIVCLECLQCDSILGIEPEEVFRSSAAFYCPVCRKDVTQSADLLNLRVIYCNRQHFAAPVWFRQTAGE